jgi:GNAT superfamily N-acetyltransferase
MAGSFANTEVEALHGEGFEHDPLPGFDWQAQLDRYSLGWVCARDDRELVGFLNVVWDGSSHAFILDTVVARSHRRRNVGTKLVAVAAERAKAAGCEWLHVDFEDHWRGFYFGSRGLKPSNTGLVQVVSDIVAALGSDSGRNPYDRPLSDLVGELATRSEEFRNRWASRPIESRDRLPDHSVPG